MCYGALPEDLGLVDISPKEMMFWLYCPIKVPRGSFVIPKNLEQFRPITEAVVRRESVANKYVYLTAKTLWVGGGYIGNRPGWHSDGFGTDDVNYIWYDSAPTDFFEDSFNLPKDCEISMKIMDTMGQAAEYANRLVHYPDRHLLRLDEKVIHRSPVNFEAGMRTFVKVSISYDRYNLKGNSINHDLGVSWPLYERRDERNHPHDTAERYDHAAA